MGLGYMIIDGKVNSGCEVFDKGVQVTRGAEWPSSKVAGLEVVGQPSMEVSPVNHLEIRTDGGSGAVVGMLTVDRTGRWSALGI